MTAAPLLRDGALFIDNTTFESLTTCHRLAQYRILRKRESVGKASALHFGGALHAGLDVRYREGGNALDSLAKQQLAACDYLESHPVEAGDYRTNDLACDVLAKYALTFPGEEFVVEQRDGKPLVELPFAMPLGTVRLPESLMLWSQTDRGAEAGMYTEVPIVWTGKIDLVVQRGGQLWFLDHKSTSIAGPTYFDQFRLSNQMEGYAWALSRLLDQTPLGVCINMLGVRRPLKSGKCNIDFAREWIHIPRHAIDEWQFNTLSILGDFFASLARDYFPMEKMWCVTKFGRKCDYFDVCTLPQAHREAMLTSNAYKDITWSPLD